MTEISINIPNWFLYVMGGLMILNSILSIFETYLEHKFYKLKEWERS